MVNQLARINLCLWLLLSILRMGSLQVEQTPYPSASLSSPDTTKFPYISAYLSVRDSQGNFIPGLNPSQVTILEDGQPAPVKVLEQLHPGLQFVLAVNPGRSFAIRDALGFSRYDLLVEGLKKWSSSGSKLVPEDLSLVVTNGPQVTHLSDPQKWFRELEAYQEDIRTAIPSIEVLVQAIEVAAEPTIRPGMGRVVLYITPPLEGDFAAGLQSIVANAMQQGIVIFVWMVASTDSFAISGATQLQDLARSTGGQFFAFSGTEPLPDLDKSLEPLGYIYSLGYDSRVSTAGVHELVAQILLTDTQITSPPRTMQVEILPPNPMFVSRPLEIVRENAEGVTEEGVFLAPKEQELEVLVDFPDGHVRDIITMTLFVDGSPVLVEMHPITNSLTWDLSGYTASGTHMVWVEVVDSLGLRNSSMKTPIQVTVHQTPRNFLRVLYRNGPVIAALTVVLAGAILSLVMILSGRVRPRPRGPGAQGVSPTLPRRHTRRKQLDPLTQPVGGIGENVASSPRHLPHWINRLQWHQRRYSPLAYAYLTRLSELDHDSGAIPIPLTANVLTLGRDPVKAMFVMSDLTVDVIHSRLCWEGFTYRLYDEGSTAGTWVNFTPVSQEGVLLEHGDLIHIGRLSFRYTLREPGRLRKPVVHREDPLA